MEIHGKVVFIFPQYKDATYKVLKVKTPDEETITARGVMPNVKQRDKIKLIGDFEIDQKGRNTFVATNVFPEAVESLSVLKNFLISKNIPGVGNKTATKIIDEFGEKTVETILHDPKQLLNISGIDVSRAEKIHEYFLESFGMWELTNYLSKFNLPSTYAQKAFAVFGDDALEMIKDNPYILVDITNKVNFSLLDKMAYEMGMTYLSDVRLEAAAKYILNSKRNDGDTYCTKEVLIDNMQKMLGLTKEQINNVLIDLRATGDIIFEVLEDKEVIYLKDMYYAETNIAATLISLKNSKSSINIRNIDKKIEKIEQKEQIELSNMQKEAIKAVAKNNVVVITRRPGTGKTTVIKSIIDIFGANDRVIELAAPTGRAAKRMSQATMQDAQTLHKLLQIGKIDDDAIESNSYYVEKIEADIVIVDEVSMVDTLLMDYLVKALLPETKLILVGDVDQLSSVGPGNVLNDIIDSGQISVIKLDKIFRQAAKSKIIQNAHNVNKGMMLDTFKDKKTQDGDNFNDDFFYISTLTQSWEDTFLSMLSGRLETLGFDFMQNIQVLTPTKQGQYGVENLNTKIQNTINPKDETKKEIFGLNGLFREGDRVIHIVNNYDMKWHRGNEKDFGIFNGEVGIITKIKPEEKKVTVEFEDGKIADYIDKDIDQLKLAYALTIHKAQGSEYDVVIMVIKNVNSYLLKRNVLYTGITRAKKMLIIFSDSTNIQRMVANNTSRVRQTSLKFYLLEASKDREFRKYFGKYKTYQKYDFNDEEELC